MTCVKICCVEGIFHDKRSVDIDRILTCSMHNMLRKANWDFLLFLSLQKVTINYAFS